MRYVYCCAGVKLKANSFRQLSKIPGNCFKMREEAVTELPLYFFGRAEWNGNTWNVLPQIEILR